MAAISRSCDGRLDQRLAHGARHFEQHFAALPILELLPDEQPLLRHQALEDVREIGRMERVDARVQLGQVLPLLQLLEQVALGAFLAVRERRQDAVLLEQPRDVVERLVQAAVRRSEGHGSPRIRQPHDAVTRAVARA